MTYRQLLHKLTDLSDGQLDKGVIVYASEWNDYYPACDFCIHDITEEHADSRLDHNDPYLFLA